MRKLYIITGLLLITTLAIGAQQPDFPSRKLPIAIGTGLTGPYLGQEKPGMKPELFATELISKYGNESQLLISPDGTRMYFQSDRPIDPAESDFEWNIWYVDKVDGVWGIPKSIGRPINGRGDTGGPSVTTDGTMYFTLFTFGGSNTSTLYRSKYLDKIYQEPEKLPDMINKDKNQFDSYIAPDESYLIFSMYMQRGSHNDPDLFISFRDKDDHWSEVINLGPTINSLGIEGSATLTPDGKILAYSKANYELSNGWDIYWVDAIIIETLNPKESNKKE